jgi:hypothetical protein
MKEGRPIVITSRGILPVNATSRGFRERTETFLRLMI